MTIRFFPGKEDPGKDQASSYNRLENLEPDLHELNIADGSEFLDDGIRMKDQPFEETAVKEEE